MNTTTTKANTIMLSKKGMKELKKAIHDLEHDRHALIRGLHEIDRLTSHDERLEKAERLARLEMVQLELADKHQTLHSARIIPSRSARLKVALGSVVDLIDQQGRMVRYTLVDTREANPSDGRISVASPLGQSLIGKAAHDIVQWHSVIGHNQVRLVRVA